MLMKILLLSLKNGCFYTIRSFRIHLCFSFLCKSKHQTRYAFTGKENKRKGTKSQGFPPSTLCLFNHTFVEMRMRTCLCLEHQTSVMMALCCESRPCNCSLVAARVEQSQVHIVLAKLGTAAFNQPALQKAGCKELAPIPSPGIIMIARTNRPGCMLEFQ